MFNFSLFDNLLDGVVVTARNEQVIYVNEALTSITHIKRRQFLKKNIHEAFKTLPDILKYLSLSTNDKDHSSYSEIKILNEEIGLKVLQISKQINGEHSIYIFRDVSVEETLHSKYKREISQKENLIAQLNRNVFELEFLLSTNSLLLKTSPNFSKDRVFKKACKTLDCDAIFILQVSEQDHKIRIDTNKSLYAFNPQIEKTDVSFVPQFFKSEIEAILEKNNGNHFEIASIEKDNWVLQIVPVAKYDKIVSLFIYTFSLEKKQNAQLNSHLLVALSQQMSLIEENHLLFQQTITDAKTNLYNTRYFQYCLENEITRSERYGRPLSLVVFDIDHFKKLNDTYGHLAGDAVLIKVASILKSSFRKNDIVARFGGEEFVVLCLETSHENLFKTVDNIREKIAQTSFEYEDKVLSVTISGGISAFPDSAKNPEALFATADRALYEAKRTGRNKIVLYNKSLEIKAA